MPQNPPAPPPSKREQTAQAIRRSSQNETVKLTAFLLIGWLLGKQ